MKKLPAILLVLTLVASGSYIAIYLNRWEWNRALFVTMIFVIAQIALIGWMVVQRLRTLEERVGEYRAAEEEIAREILLEIRESRPDHDRFAWLRDSATQHNVFITMVVGAGVALSALAWILDRIAETTVTPARERKLAAELTSIAFPPCGLVADEGSLIAGEPSPNRDPELQLLIGETRGRRRKA